MRLQTLLNNYQRVVNEIDETVQREAAHAALSEQFRFVGPTVGQVEGREAMLQAIKGLRERAPAESLTMRQTTRPDEHHGWFRFGWEFVNEEGETISTGMDVGRVGADGRLALIVAFFGSPSDG